MTAEEERGGGWLARATQVPWQVARAAGPGLVVAAVLLVVVAIAGSWLLDPQRSYVVTARTLSATIAFDGSMTWSFARATVCQPRGDRQRASRVGASESETCDTRRYEAGATPGALTLAWRPADKVLVRVTSEESVEIQALDDDTAALPGDALVIVAMEDWRTDGMLLFAGSIEIGSVASSGNTDFLLDGRYEARQTDLLSHLTGWRTTVVQEGLLNRGEAVRIVEPCDPLEPNAEEDDTSEDDPSAGTKAVEETVHEDHCNPDATSDAEQQGGGNPNTGSSGQRPDGEATASKSNNGPDIEPVRPMQTFGHLSPSGEQEDPAIHALAVSTRGRSMLELTSYGIAEPIRIRPNWIESAVASPVLLAAAVLVSFLANAVQFASSMGQSRDAVPVSPTQVRESNRVGQDRAVRPLPGSADGHGTDLSAAASEQDGSSVHAHAAPPEAKEIAAQKPADAAPVAEPNAVIQTPGNA